MAGMPAGATSKLRYIFHPVPPFCWWQVHVGNGGELQVVQLLSPWLFAHGYRYLYAACSVYGSEGDCSLVMAQAFVAGKPESGHLRCPLGIACPQDRGWGARGGKGGIRRGEVGGPSMGLKVQLVLSGPQAYFSIAVGVKS